MNIIIVNISIVICCEFLPPRKLLILLTRPFLVRVESAALFIFFSTENTSIGLTSTPYAAEPVKMSSYDTFGNNVKNRFTRLSFVGSVPLPPVQTTPSFAVSNRTRMVYIVYLRIQSDIFFVHSGKPRKTPCKKKKHYEELKLFLVNFKS